MAPPPPPAAAASAPGQPAPELRPVTCIRCREAKPASTTNMTGDGPICDRCLARG
jgi:hypothetical protein